MVRIAALLFAFVTSLTVLSPAAIAQPAGGYYSVTLAAQPAETKSVVRGMVFACNGGMCSAAEGTSRPTVICASVARQLGPVTSFVAGGAPLDGEALAKCNAKADTTKLAARR